MIDESKYGDTVSIEYTVKLPHGFTYRKGEIHDPQGNTYSIESNLSCWLQIEGSEDEIDISNSQNLIDLMVLPE